MNQRRKIMALIAVFALAITLIGGIKWSAIELPHRNDAAAATQTQTAETDDSEAVQTEAEEGTDETETENTGEVWYYLHNSECLADDDPSNDFDFGPRPDIENMTTQELYELLRDVMEYNPVIGAAILAYVDKICGTRYDGEFFDASRNSAEAMNLAKDRFIEDPALYAKTLKAFFSFVESAAYKISVVHYTSGIRDQMYINPFTGNGIPDIVVFETVQEDGYFLRIDFKIKGSTVGGNPAAGNGGDNVGTIALLLRADCLFQPCNVAEVLDIVPQKNPAKESSAKTTPAKTTPSSSTPSKTTPATPSKTPSSTPSTPAKPSKPVTPVTPVTPVDPKKPVAPSYNKDKSKGTQGDLVKPNDNTGPGPDTNNGVGATKSTKDASTSTNNGQSYSNYGNDQKELATNPGKSASTDNTPTYNPSKGNSGGNSSSSSSKPAAVDNNGTGSGATNSAPINNPTPTAKPETTGGQKIKNDSSSNAAPEWGGTGD